MAFHRTDHRRLPRVPAFENLEPRTLFAAIGNVFHTTATLPEATEGAAVAVVGNEAIFAGGSTTSGYAQVNIYNAATAQWSAARLSRARPDITALAVDDEALFAGGQPGIDTSSIVDIYNASTGAWSAGNLSVGRIDMAATTVGNLAIFAGGETAATNLASTVTNAVDFYDAIDGKWFTGSLSQARSGIAAASVGDLALFAGGQGDEKDGVTQYSSVVDIYNTKTGRWSTATLSQARTGIDALTVGNTVLFAGGSAATGLSTAVDIYNSTTGHWSTATLPSAQALQPAVVGDRAFFFFGSTVEIYDSTTGKWSSEPLSPSESAALANPSESAVDSDIVLGGGATQNASIDTNAACIYDTSNGRAYTTTLSQARSAITAATVDSTALFAGGVVGDSGSGDSSAVDLFTPADLAGTVSLPRGSSVPVSLTNNSTSALPAPDSVAVYASATGVFDDTAVLLGSSRVNTTLPPGATEQLSIPIAIPRSLHAGSYHLLAAAGPPGQLVEFAAQRRLLVVGAGGVVNAAPSHAAVFVPVILPRLSAFSTMAIGSDSLFGDASRVEISGEA